MTTPKKCRNGLFWCIFWSIVVCIYPTLVYNRGMDQLVAVNIISNKVEKEDSTTCLKGKMIELDDIKESKMLETTCPKDTIMDLREEEENIKMMTPRLETGSNDVNNTPIKIGSILYVQHKYKQYH